MIAASAPAQNPPLPIRLESITINDGLSQGYVTDIIQDKKGFMWFTTGDGLNKYDGYTFTVYHHDPSDTTSIGSDDLVCVFEDSKERLWIATRHNGIDLFDRERGIFRHIRETGGNSLRSDDIMDIVEDREGAIWIRTHQGIDRLELGTPRTLQGGNGHRDPYSLQDLFFTPITLDSAFEARKGKSGAAAVFVDSDGRVLITTNNKVWEVVFYGTSSSYRLIEKFHFPVKDSAAVAIILEDTVSNCLLLNSGDLFKFPDGNFNLPEKIADSISIMAPSVIDKEQRLWLPTGNMFTRIAIPSGQHEVVGSDETALINAGNYSAVLYSDRNGVVWVGTGGYGLLKYTTEKERFHHILAGQYFYQLSKDRDERLITNTFQILTVKKDVPVIIKPLAEPSVKKNFRTGRCFPLL